MLYVVYEQKKPIKTGFKDKRGVDIYEANLEEIGTVKVPDGKCPIQYARETYGVSNLLVEWLYGYDEEGNRRKS